MKIEKNQREADLRRYNQNRSQFTKIKPHDDGWIVYGRTIASTLDKAVEVRGAV